MSTRALQEVAVWSGGSGGLGWRGGGAAGGDEWRGLLAVEGIKSLAGTTRPGFIPHQQSDGALALHMKVQVEGGARTICTK